MDEKRTEMGVLRVASRAEARGGRSLPRSLAKVRCGAESPLLGVKLERHRDPGDDAGQHA